MPRMETDEHHLYGKKTRTNWTCLAFLFLHIAALGMVTILILAGYGVLSPLAILFLVTCVNTLLNVALFLHITGIYMRLPSETTPDNS